MANDAIRTAIQAASDYLTQHPEQARSTDSAATATLVDGLVVRVTGPNGATITTDMVPSVGGTMRAAMLGVALDVVEVTVDSVSDDRGLLGLDDNVPAGPLSGRVAVRLTSAATDPTALEEIAHWGVKHCPVCEALERPIPVMTEVSTA